jgi:hypothetical protein
MIVAVLDLLQQSQNATLDFVLNQGPPCLVIEEWYKPPPSLVALFKFLGRSQTELYKAADIADMADRYIEALGISEDDCGNAKLDKDLPGSLQEVGVSVTLQA